MKNISYVVLSPEPSEAPEFLPLNIEWINYVDKFSDHKGLHKARLEAIKRVNTPYWIYVDSDDPLPEGVKEPDNSFIMYGTEIRHHLITLVKNIYIPQKFNWLRFIERPNLIHKAVCSTAATKKIIPYLPQEGAYLTEALIFALLAQIKEPDIHIDFKYNWNVFGNTCHTWPDVNEAIANTSHWLKVHGKNTVKQLILQI